MIIAYSYSLALQLSFELWNLLFLYIPITRLLNLRIKSRPKTAVFNPILLEVMVGRV